jgi:hypothetical protein
VSIQTNISLLSISNSSTSTDNEEQIEINQQSSDRDSSSSREGSSPLPDESEEPKVKHTIDLDPYILHKHLNGISSTVSSLVETDIDKSVNELFDENKSSYLWQNNDYDPRSIRPPPFSQYIKQVRDSKNKIKPVQRRSARIPVRTTKAEQLKLARQQSASENRPDPPQMRSFTAIPQQHSTNRISRSRPNSRSSFRQSESARSCKVALRSDGPLHLSSLLIKQMRQDIQSNRGKYLFHG